MNFASFATILFHDSHGALKIWLLCTRVCVSVHSIIFITYTYLWYLGIIDTFRTSAYVVQAAIKSPNSEKYKLDLIDLETNKNKIGNLKKSVIRKQAWEHPF